MEQTKNLEDQTINPEMCTGWYKQAVICWPSNEIKHKVGDDSYKKENWFL